MNLSSIKQFLPHLIKHRSLHTTHIPLLASSIKQFLPHLVKHRSLHTTHIPPLAWTLPESDSLPNDRSPAHSTLILIAEREPPSPNQSQSLKRFNFFPPWVTKPFLTPYSSRIRQVPDTIIETIILTPRIQNMCRSKETKNSCTFHEFGECDGRVLGADFWPWSDSSGPTLTYLSFSS